MMERVAWVVPFARRVRTIRMCSLDARGLGPIQATLFESASYTTAALLNSLFEHPAKMFSWMCEPLNRTTIVFPQTSSYVAY
jgi:hypothetical protein